MGQHPIWFARKWQRIWILNIPHAPTARFQSRNTHRCRPNKNAPRNLVRCICIRWEKQIMQTWDCMCVRITNFAFVILNCDLQGSRGEIFVLDPVRRCTPTHANARAGCLALCARKRAAGWKKPNEFFLLKRRALARDLFQRQICLGAAFVMFFNSWLGHCCRAQIQICSFAGAHTLCRAKLFMAGKKAPAVVQTKINSSCEWFMYACAWLLVHYE